MKKIILFIFAVLIGLGIYHYPKLSSTLNIATGFSAKNICSGYFISGFDADSLAEEALNPISPAFSLVSFAIDEQAKRVSATVMGAFERHAVYREGLGCTLLVSGQSNIETSVTPISFEALSDSAAWPIGNADVEQNDDSINYQLLDEAMNRAFSEIEPNGKRNVKAVGIVYKGKLIAEQYADGVDKNTPLLSWSMAKSITGLQVGLLVKDGKLDVYDRADVDAWKNADDPRSKLTLDMLMRMSSGLEFNETYGINTDVSRMLSIEADSAKYAANKPLEYPVNTHWAYSSGTSNIISGIVKKTIDGSFQDYYQYTQDNLFKPLGITTAISEVDASDSFIGSSYFYASARDWAKLGQLMLQNGQWNAQQLLPENWVEYLTTATKTQPLNKYAAQFWLNNDPEDESQPRVWPSVTAEAYYMGGYQGQYVVVIPSLELVIVRFGFTAPGTKKGIERFISDTVAALSE